jgi:hypothetical protein
MFAAEAIRNAEKFFCKVLLKSVYCIANVLAFCKVFVLGYLINNHAAYIHL